MSKLRDVIIEQLDAHNKRLEGVNANLLAALRHIAFEPLTDDPEADAEACLKEAERIAADAVAGHIKAWGASNG